MWEGQSVSRELQITVGILLAIAGLPFFVFGVMVSFVVLKGSGQPNAAWVGVVFLLLGLLGLICLVMAYRLIWARGVNQGGGVLSPLGFKIGGYGMLLLPVLAAYLQWDTLDYTFVIALPAVWILATFFFVAARHRGAMRKIAK